MDAVFLARLQFAITIGFHFFFPPVTIGLAWLLVVVERKAWKTGDPDWERAGRFFAKLLGLTFAVGVATGIVMEFQFGTNWAEYSKVVGDIFGAPLAAEGVFTFFLESGFLGLYLFGRNRVKRGFHWFAILMVAVGSTMSAFWIIAANSWQQTPAGFTIANGRAELLDFWAAIFNDSTMLRYLHTVTAALTSGAFFMAGISAWMLVKGRHEEVAKKTLTVAVIFGLIFSVLSAFPTGHEHAKQVAATQPTKFAAIEGLYETQDGAPLAIFGLPTDRPPELKAPIVIPNLLSWMAFGDIDATVRGIQDFPESERPPLLITFASFHTMVGLGTMFIGMMLLAVFWLRGGKLFTKKWLLWGLVIAAPLPLFACQFGWITAEVGRQPWIVYPVERYAAEGPYEPIPADMPATEVLEKYKGMRVADANSVTVSAGEILTSIILFSLIYACLGALYLYILFRKVGQGPPPLAAAVGKEASA